jgi:Alw26I/Eco31I/Esp3I family type II restriction m6 adenine DNA methyltransferase
MSTSQSVEGAMLSDCEQLLLANSGDQIESRLEILEGVSALTGGWSLGEFRRLFPATRTLTCRQATAIALQLQHLIADTGIPSSIALASLARPSLSPHEQRRTGSFYTDFRLAFFVGQEAARACPRGSLIDPASGTGILLVSTLLAQYGSNRSELAQALRERVYACDLSSAALRGAHIALASLTDDLDAIRSLQPNLLEGDSLLRSADNWNEIAPAGFDLVVGNPPWEKIKATRHEIGNSLGHVGHYGDDAESNDDVDRELKAARSNLANYSAALAERFPLASEGEPDYYKAFLQLATELVNPSGQISLVLPAGVIRSAGTRALRRYLSEHSTELDITVLENRARFFAIDTRFKFIVLHASIGSGPKRPFVIRHARGTSNAVLRTGIAHLGRTTVEKLRPDLTIPEVRSDKEWRLYKKIYAKGNRLGDPHAGWDPAIMREVDMTRDRRHFSRCSSEDSLAVLEGRMVHQHRVGSKAYVSGSGRSAKWTPLEPGKSEITPQFWIPLQDVAPNARARSLRARCGFCDVTGQTNERTVIAGMVPEGVICGNKVPTVEFPESLGPDAPWAFLALANSFVFDWTARRIVTTTLNYFLLLSLPVPSQKPGSAEMARLATLARCLHELDRSGESRNREIAELRAKIDALVAKAYGLSRDELELVMSDFPLLDRGQPPLPNEDQSTVTHDAVLAAFDELSGCSDRLILSRLEQARTLGANAYVPAEFKLLAPSA